MTKKKHSNGPAKKEKSFMEALLGINKFAL